MVAAPVENIDYLIKNKTKKKNIIFAKMAILFWKIVLESSMANHFSPNMITLEILINQTSVWR